MRFFPVLNGLVLACGLLASGLLASAAMAQDAAQPAAAKPTDVKPIGDWTVRCFPVATPSPCDMYEQLDDKTSHQRVLSLSIAYVPSSDRHAIQVAVPLGVAIAKGVVIQASGFTSATLPYRRCDRAGCYVEMILPNESITGLARSDANASLKIVADNGKPFDLRFSLNGFSAARDAMAALAREKAKSAPAAPAPAPAP